VTSDRVGSCKLRPFFRFARTVPNPDFPAPCLCV